MSSTTIEPTEDMDLESLPPLEKVKKQQAPIFDWKKSGLGDIISDILNKHVKKGLDVKDARVIARVEFKNRKEYLDIEQSERPTDLAITRRLGNLLRREIEVFAVREYVDDKSSSDSIIKKTTPNVNHNPSKVNPSKVKTIDELISEKTDILNKMNQTRCDDISLKINSIFRELDSLSKRIDNIHYEKILNDNNDINDNDNNELENGNNKNKKEKVSRREKESELCRCKKERKRYMKKFIKCINCKRFFHDTCYEKFTDRNEDRWKCTYCCGFESVISEDDINDMRDPYYLEKYKEKTNSSPLMTYSPTTRESKNQDSLLQ